MEKAVRLFASSSCTRRSETSAKASAVSLPAKSAAASPSSRKARVGSAAPSFNPSRFFASCASRCSSTLNSTSAVFASNASTLKFSAVLPVRNAALPIASA